MRIRAGAFVFIIMLALAGPMGAGEQAPAGAQPARVIVQARSLEAAAAAVTAAGGTITHRLGIIQAVGAQMDARQLARLRRSPADVRVFEDRPLALAGEPGKPSAVPALVGADQLHAANITGRGVGVAFIDTGVFDTAGTMTDTQDAFRVRAAYDAVSNMYSLDAVLDENGHGSHVISVAASSNYSLADGGTRRYNGVAPDARLIVVKAFDDNGWGSYANVIRGIDWVVANREEYGIRVLNCSFGAPPRSHYWEDPLNQAIMRAWQAGIVVVASAGNTGPAAQTIRVPGNVPYVITVGAFTDNYTPTVSSDDRLTSFSSAGPTYDRFVKPDVVAPGGHILGLMDKKSILPREHKQYVDKENAKYFTMSGTSQAAAVVSGTVALLLQAQPQLTPDDVKCRLLSSARGAINPQDLRAYSIFQQGAGMVWTPDAVAGTAVGCANVGLNVGNDLSGEQHYAGRARQLADGTFVVDGVNADGTVWDGLLQPGGGVFLHGDPWTDIAVGLAGDPWTDTFMWPSGYPWEGTHVWSAGLSETMSINVWVQQQ